MYFMKIDTLNLASDFILAQSKKAELGFETYVSLKKLVEGKHVLQVNRKRIKDDDTLETNVAKIPFWYFKD